MDHSRLSILLWLFGIIGVIAVTTAVFFMIAPPASTAPPPSQCRMLYNGTKAENFENCGVEEVKDYVNEFFLKQESTVEALQAAYDKLGEKEWPVLTSKFFHLHEHKVLESEEEKINDESSIQENLDKLKHPEISPKFIQILKSTSMEGKVSLKTTISIVEKLFRVLNKDSKEYFFRKDGSLVLQANPDVLYTFELSHDLTPTSIGPLKSDSDTSSHLFQVTLNDFESYENTKAVLYEENNELKDIKITLPEKSSVKIVIYDMKELRELKFSEKFKEEAKNAIQSALLEVKQTGESFYYLNNVGITQRRFFSKLENDDVTFTTQFKKTKSFLNDHFKDTYNLFKTMQSFAKSAKYFEKILNQLSLNALQIDLSLLIRSLGQKNFESFNGDLLALMFEKLSGKQISVNRKCYMNTECQIDCSGVVHESPVSCLHDFFSN